MNLDRLQVRARLRSNWQSVDLGIVLARRHWLQMTLLWLIPAAPLFALMALLFPHSPNLAIFCIWWLKPLFERLPLLVVSRQLFGEQIHMREALSQFRRANGRDWFAWLSWRRLSFTRAFDLPVTVLEQATGRVRNARLALLHRKTAGTASWLHIVGAHVEMIFGIGVAALVLLMLPEQLDIDWWPMLINNENLMQWLANGMSLLVMAMVAPFYVCAGFMLYIGRRIDLEAWDLEIHFRKLRARLTSGRKAAANTRPVTARSTSTSALLCAAAIGLCTLLSLPQPALADRVNPGEAQQLIDDTLAGDDFHLRETKTGWRMREFDARKYRFPDWFIAFIEWLESRSDGEAEWDGAFWPLIAGIIELILWILAVGICVWLLWNYRQQLRALLGQHPRKKVVETRRPETLFGLDLRRESLPDDITAEVLRLWRAGAEREALGLLYRASLSDLISRYDCPFQDHHTEAECAHLVRDEAQQDPRLHPALVQFFGLLTATWQRLAYAHKAPANAQLEALCAQWQQVFRTEETAR
ncbi:DUF4129 domain-containing protein [Microbulbifer harenosus]|uniref:DUF4129 domain-containing protein n=1 Tax=Microbulbifer harenosus TaxID=2576840 RepID=A0ABY2UL05_9GAMM|nr:DUF4129 domain-containing protein [Microbulbifer harenosus]TLM79123.1 DUF4129 domain-containing protein [Microbulbifer harenosus]